MRIVIDQNNNKYIDQDLFNYINKIWLNYDIEIEKDSNIFFSKNTTVNRLITDCCGKNISRVIKKEKADYVVINRFSISNYPQYYDGSNISDDDTKEIVYGFYNQSCEIQDTVELILEFINRGQEVKFVNQDRLNDSLNNGFIIDKESYFTIKELVDSNYSENHQLAVNMLISSDLKANWEWILYLFHKKEGLINNYDKKNVIVNYLTSFNLNVNKSSLFSEIDKALSVTKNQDVIDRFVYLIKSRFQENINNYFSEKLGTNKFVLEDFKVKYNG